MTLHRQLIIALSVVFMAMFLGTWVTNIQSTRAFLEDQLSSHAQDTATSLGLSLSPHVAHQDDATITAMVNAIFDRGYYRAIVVTRTDGSPLVERHMPLKIAGVPAWFVTRLPLQTPERSALVMSGWKQVAVVKIRSHPGYAYAELWNTTSIMLTWFSALTILSIAFTSVALRFLLKPLRAVEQQAEAICNRRYTLQETLPRTRELRSVVEAMNRMTRKVQDMFDAQAGTAERLREMAFADGVTGLGNRRYFEAQALAQLKSDRVRQGALLLLRLNGLQQINEMAGFAAGDRLLQAVTALISRRLATPEECIMARLSGGDFALMAAHIDGSQAQEWAQAITDRLAQLHDERVAPTAEVANIGIACYQHGDQLSELMAEADAAMRVALESGPNTWSKFQRAPSTPTEEPGRQAWAAHLKSAIAERNIVLYTQQAVSVGSSSHPLHREILARLNTADGTLHSAFEFMPIANQLGLAAEIDILVVEKLVAHLGRQPALAPVAVNLSSATLRDPASVKRIMRAVSTCRAQLVFEISELVAAREQESLKLFASEAHALGHAIGIDHFGRAFVPFGYLQSLRPKYVKIDGTFTHDIEHDRDRQFYIRSLASVAHSLDITIIASAVERPETLSALAALGVDGAQGYATGEILPIGQNVL